MKYATAVQDKLSGIEDLRVSESGVRREERRSRWEACLMLSKIRPGPRHSDAGEAADRAAQRRAG